MSREQRFDGLLVLWLTLGAVRCARAKLATVPCITAGLIRAKTLLAIYYLDTQRWSDSSLVLGEAIGAAQFLGYHLSETGQIVLWYVDTLVFVGFHSVQS